MADFEVPWVVNGSKHSARLFRRTLQQQVGPGSGVDRLGDLKVQALNVPGAGFRVAPGGGVAQSRDTDSAARESYGPILTRELTVSGVPGTGSSGGRRDLVILEITDPEMESKSYPAPTATEGWQDGDNFVRVSVIADVDSLVPVAERPVKRLEQIKSGAWANVTGVTLAAVSWPKSTGTITNAMIEDLRQVQSPRTMRRMVTVFPPNSVGNGRAMPVGVYGSWPLIDSERPVVEVPEWATKVRISCTMAGVRFSAPATGATVGGLRTGFGATPPGENTIMVEDIGSTAGRHLYAVIGTHDVPAAVRGTRQVINVQAARTAGTGQWLADYQTSILIDYEFSGEL